MRRRYGLTISLVLLSALFANLSFAQTNAAQADSAEAAVECFPLTYEGRVEDCREGYYSAQGILSNPDDFSDELVEAVLDGLELYAIETEDSHLSNLAIGWVSGAGMPGYPGGPRPGIVARLDRIYSAVDSYGPRSVIVTSLALQRERAPAAHMLERIAREPPNPRWRWHQPLPAVAVRSLEELGPEGEASLEALRQSGIVKAPSEPKKP